jgi:hypothetical protein
LVMPGSARDGFACKSGIRPDFPFEAFADLFGG